MIGVKLPQLKKYTVNVEIINRDLKALEMIVKKVKRQTSILPQRLAASFNYPSILSEVKAGLIKKVVDRFAVVEAAVSNINEMITKFSGIPTRVSSNLKNEKKKNADIKPIKIEEYISKIISYERLEDDHDSNGVKDDGNDDINEE